jgi:hypothetical protein
MASAYVFLKVKMNLVIVTIDDMRASKDYYSQLHDVSIWDI